MERPTLNGDVPEPTAGEVPRQEPSAEAAVDEDRAPAATSIVSLVSDWMAEANSRVRLTTELVLAEAKLAAISIALMVFLAMLAAAFVMGAWGLLIAGLVNALVAADVPLWTVLIALCVVHAGLAMLLWNRAVYLSRHLEFRATRAQFNHAPEKGTDVASAKAAR